MIADTLAIFAAYWCFFEAYDDQMLMYWFTKIKSVHILLNFFEGMRCGSQGEGQHGSTLCKTLFAIASVFRG